MDCELLCQISQEFVDFCCNKYKAFLLHENKTGSSKVLLKNVIYKW